MTTTAITFAIVCNILFVFALCVAARRGDAAMENHFASKRGGK